ncbi:hypothetical protein [Marinobacterium jannaschii]|uniref:hypothetical protein n=1 Tax=Marinobacterium jannaschii TaxID=64970 RepID=UPI0004849919|nr:hypothetical protein [Marinobacterium jannaschii]
MIVCYTMAPVANLPETFAAAYPHSVQLAAWAKYGTHCRDTSPAYLLLMQGTDPSALFDPDVDLSGTQIVFVGSEQPIADQALVAIGAYLFDPSADGLIVMDRSIARAMYRHPAHRLIDYAYDGQQALSDDLAAMGLSVDLTGGLADIKPAVWAAVKGALL